MGLENEIDEAVKILERYVDADTNYRSEYAVNHLCHLVEWKEYLSEEFVKALNKEVLRQRDFYLKNAKIVERETQPSIERVVVWNTPDKKEVL